MARNERCLLNILKLILCFLVSLICLIFVCRKVNINEVTSILLQTNYIWIVIGTVIGVLKMWITAYRCCYLLPSDQQLSVRRSFHYYSIGTMANMILPFRVGDIVRARLLADNLNISKAKILGTIASEHIIDFIILCFLLVSCIGLYSYSLPRQIMPTMSIVLLVVGTFLAGLVVFGSRSTSNLKLKFAKRIPQKLFFLSQLIMNFYAGFFRLGGWANMLMIISATICIWLAQGYWAYLLLHSLGLIESYQLSLGVIPVIVVMMGIAVMIPSTPGYIGTFHLMVMLGLMQMGVPKAAALSYAILTHAHAVICAIVVGIYSLWKVNFNRDLLRDKPRTDPICL